eukprot:TRINITY_DN523_c0_g4_i1.p1 TRINITY_DN523_c0_g4~~TRINITY_DN523_c0_g4_i1.p1  ORF type:complete len:270 (-),score=112.02 TRINITY_DN523_c0_g4_i1:26-835(-)
MPNRLRSIVGSWSKCERAKRKKRKDRRHCRAARRQKLKRMKQKYAEQDEEDLALARKLYGTQRVRVDGEEPLDAVEADEDGDDKKEEDEPIIEERAKRCYNCGEEGHERVSCPQASAKKIDHKKEIAELLEEEGLGGDETGGSDDAMLESLVCDPQEDDALMFVLTCCAPYAAAAKWTYKRKLVPGTLKRGKAVKACVATFLAQSKGRSNDLLRALDLNEANQVMMSNVEVVRVGGAGGGKGQRGGKAKGKGGGGRKAHGANKRVNRKK